MLLENRETCTPAVGVSAVVSIESSHNLDLRTRSHVEIEQLVAELSRLTRQKGLFLVGGFFDFPRQWTDKQRTRYGYSRIGVFHASMDAE